MVDSRSQIAQPPPDQMPAGDEVCVVIVAQGLAARENVEERSSIRNDIEELHELGRKANELLGVKQINFLNLPDNRLDSMDRLDLIKRIEKELENFQPDLVYTHHAGDLNVDHRRVHEAVVCGCRPFPGQTAQTLLFFEVQSSTEWNTPDSSPAHK